MTRRADYRCDLCNKVLNDQKCKMLEFITEEKDLRCYN